MESNIEERFWSYVNKNGPTMKGMESCCWEWKGGILSKGYGGFRVGKESWRAHRYAWTITHGEITEGDLILHRCDNRKCVRPDHLFDGTQKDNVQDRIKKGRSNYAVGDRHGQSRLSEETVRGIKIMLKTHTQAEVAEFFNEDRRLIHSISTGRIWKWLHV